MVKIGSVDPEIMSEKFILKKETTFAILELWSYWSSQCSQIQDSDEPFKMKMAIFQAVLECQDHE